jgi:L-histidine N-alpha-methyltransferase
VAKYQSPWGEYDREVTASQRTLVLAAHFGEKQLVSSIVNVAIHSSQFPEKVRRDLLESLRARAVNHKFHYDSVKQTQKWLALHQAHSPSRNDADCAATYDRAFEAAAAQINSKAIHLIGLGCGGGQKDTRLLRLLHDRAKELFYTPCDVSTAMVLTARETALSVLTGDRCFPLVCDLTHVGDLSTILDQGVTEHASRITSFFGMIPNFEPEMILPKLASFVGKEDFLLFSANLAPGRDYDSGMRKILPQYDNPLTRDWLLAFLFDLGFEPRDGELRFAIEDVNTLKRVVARFHFQHSRTVGVGDERFEFRPGDSIRLFFSYRYTTELVLTFLKQHGLHVLDQWITKSEEEGVFLCRRA